MSFNPRYILWYSCVYTRGVLRCANFAKWCYSNNMENTPIVMTCYLKWTSWIALSSKIKSNINYLSCSYGKLLIKISLWSIFIIEKNVTLKRFIHTWQVSFPPSRTPAHNWDSATMPRDKLEVDASAAYRLLQVWCSTKFRWTFWRTWLFSPTEIKTTH